jgi:hypothetical protein
MSFGASRTLLLAALLAALASAEPEEEWPWHPKTTTTVPAQGAHDFEEGLAAGLGLQSVGVCFEKSPSSVKDLYEAVQFYRKGGVLNKARALKSFAEFTKDVVEALKGCSSAMQAGSDYERLSKLLMDKRYYSPSNALTLGLNLAEDHATLSSCLQSFEEKRYYESGLELMKIILDVLEHPGIPEKGEPAVLFGQGLAYGFGADLQVECFDDATVELTSIIGGVASLASVVNVVGGLESLFHGLMGIVPLFKDCVRDIPKIKLLLREAADFRHPAELAKVVAQNMLKNKVDISLEVVSVLVDVKGQSWQHLGEDVGKILAKIIVSEEAPSLIV